MKMQKTESKTVELVTVEMFVTAFRAGMERMLEAARLLAQLVDQDAGVFAKIRKSCPAASLNILANLERVGRGHLRVELLYDDSPAARELFDCPFEVQAKAYDSHVEVGHVEGDKICFVTKPVGDLSPAECKMVFANGRILSRAEQTQILKSRIVVGAFSPATRYKFTDDGQVVFFQKTTVSLSAWEAIGKELKERNLRMLQEKMQSKQVAKG